MTNTVRILGSRAREQVPGTSITLRAPGFRGALTQLDAGAVPRGVPPLPFADAAAGAEVMLAAQLFMELEARPPDDGPELRSRSAVAAYPRLIVPRRNGVAYALLQTDEAGNSSFALADLGDEQEAVFPLTIARDGAARRALRVLMWPAQQVAVPGAVATVARWERLRRACQLMQLTPDGRWRVPDWDALTAGPALLLLHGTFGTPQSTFGEWVGDGSFAAVRERYGNRCFAFAHPTVSVSPVENLTWLYAHLPPWREPIDIVAHARGGLLARLIAAEERLPVRNACLVGTPNDGTPLALRANLARFLGAQVAMLANVPQGGAQATLEGALCLTRIVAMRLGGVLPGIEVMEPTSALLRMLGAAPPTSQRWFTAGAQFTRPGPSANDACDARDLDAAANDLVMPSEGCHALGVAPADSLRLTGVHVHHHSYFGNSQIRDKLAAWLA